VYANDNLTFFTEKIRIDYIGELDIFARLKAIIFLHYYDGFVRGMHRLDFVGPLIGRINNRFGMLNEVINIEQSESFEIFGHTKPISIIDLSELSNEIKKLITLLYAKSLYSNARRLKKEDASLHIVIDEAHNVLSYSSSRESQDWRDHRLEVFEEIIKEGRKFGVFLTIASQRPYEISETITSQLHNYFIHRLVNQNDLLMVGKSVPFIDELSAKNVQILPVGYCIVAGQAFDAPITVKIDELEDGCRPKSENRNLVSMWKPMLANCEA
jgi:DNA helicase HerA-like ATPase